MNSDQLMARLSVLKVDGQRMITEDVAQAWYDYREQLTDDHRLARLVETMEQAPRRKQADPVLAFDGVRQLLLPYYATMALRHSEVARTIEFVSWCLLYTTHLTTEERRLLSRELMKLGTYFDGQCATSLTKQEQARLRLTIMSDVEQASFETCLLFSQHYPLLTVAEQVQFVLKNWAQLNSAFGVTILRLISEHRNDASKLSAIVQAAQYEERLTERWMSELATLPTSAATIDDTYYIYRQLIEQKLHDFGRSFHPQFQQAVRGLATALPNHYEKEVRWLQTLPSWL